jgi:6-phosphogluconolactonase
VSEVQRLGGTVVVRDDPDAMALAAADWVLEAAAASTAASGRFLVALAGGSTPRRLYQALAASPRRERGGWDRWVVFFGDERAVPPDDPSSNYRLARETLLEHVPIPPEQVHRMPAEWADLEAAAEEYSSILAALCPPWGGARVPRLDCILLGVGENGHTASLFPGDRSLEVRDRWVVPSRADTPPYDRLTLTFPVLNAASRVAFLVAGGAKSEALRAVATGSAPAAGVRPPEGELRWFLDAQAAAGL